MAPLPKTTIQHFSHPNHPLLQIHEDKQYLCDGCKTIGAGKRYRCHSCDFNLHEHCATCPTAFTSFMHPQHQLNLVSRKPQATRQNERICNVCGENVEGLFYRCKLCEFDVHPLCTQLPQHVRHALHLAHPLTLQPSSASLCLVCKSVCSSWRYRCGICCVDIHLECILAPCGETSQRSVPPPFQQPPPFHHRGPPPPPYGAYAYHPYGMPSGFNPYNMYQYPNVNLQPQGSGATNNGGKVSKMMFALVGKLTFGVLGNAIFGIPDLSSFI